MQRHASLISFVLLAMTYTVSASLATAEAKGAVRSGCHDLGVTSAGTVTWSVTYQ